MLNTNLITTYKKKSISQLHSLGIDEDSYGGFRRLSAAFEQLEEKANDADTDSEDDDDKFDQGSNSIRYLVQSCDLWSFLCGGMLWRN